MPGGLSPRQTRWVLIASLAALAFASIVFTPTAATAPGPWVASGWTEGSGR